MRKAPIGALRDSATRVYFAVLTLERPTVSAVQLRTGITRSVVYYHLCELRERGLIDWTDGKRGTLHAVAVPVDLPLNGPR